MKNRKGFTLIELLAVILILGVIALIAIPSVNNVIRQSRKGADEATGDEMIRQARTYFTTCQINGGKNLSGTECYKNFMGTTGAGYNGGDKTQLTVAGLKAELELTGEIPDLYSDSDAVFEIDSVGNVYLKFKKDSFDCANFTVSGEGQSATRTLGDEVVCSEQSA